LLQGKTTMAIEDLRYIIGELRRLEKFEKAKLLEDTLNQFILELAAKDEIKAPLETIVATPQSSDMTVPQPLTTENIHKTRELEFNTSKDEVLRPAQGKSSVSAERSNGETPQISASSQTQPRPVQSSPTEPYKRPRRTIKDEPLSEEEILVKKLLEIKDVLRDSKKK
jgi:hypothetical protein